MGVYVARIEGMRNIFKKIHRKAWRRKHARDPVLTGRTVLQYVRLYESHWTVSPINT
jgi:hypothetical protein